MSDGELFYLVFTLIYLSECVVWAGRRSVPFVGAFVRRAKPQRASSNIGSAHAGAVMLNPFPPLGRVYLSELFPLSLTVDGFSTQVGDAPNPGPHAPRIRRQFRWDTMGLIGTEGRRIYIDGERAVDLGTTKEAEAMAAMLRTLRDLDDQEQRRQVIRRCLDRSLNTNQVRRRHRWLVSRTWALRVDCVMLFFLSFLVIPFAYWRFESAPPFWWALGVNWLLMIKISLGFFFLHRRLYPGQGSDRWQYFIISLFVLQFAMRANDAVSKPWLSGYHPLAIARAVTKKDRAEVFVAKVLRDLAHPLPLADTGDESPDVFREQFLWPAVQRFCQREAIDIAAIEAPPAAEEVEPGCTRYCPRCRVQYDNSAERCADCGDQATLSIPLAGAVASRMDQGE
jgi:hypothetical protein